MRIYRAPFLVFHRGVNVLRRKLEGLFDDGDRRVDVYGGVDLPTQFVPCAVHDALKEFYL